MGVATTVSPIAAPVTVTVPILPHEPRAMLAASNVLVPERCLVIVVPLPILRLFASAVPLIVVVTPDLPIVTADALVVPTLTVAAPPASRKRALAPFDCMARTLLELGLIVEPIVISPAVKVKIREVVPPAIVRPSDAAVKVSPLIVPKLDIVGEPEPVMLPEAVKAGSVSPVVVTVPLIAGAVSVLFVKISVVAFPTSVSVASGSVNVLVVLGDQVRVPTCVVPRRS